MTARRSEPAIPRPVLRLAMIGLSVAALVGAALYLRSPDRMTPADQMVLQTRHVILHDGRSLGVQIHEVTLAQWQACHDAGLCDLDFAHKIKDVDYPATGLSYPDAMQFVAWINTESEVNWRLPTALEWTELAAEVMPEKSDPIFTDPALTWAASYVTEANRAGRALRTSGAFSVTAGGIADLDGNVWEWTQDCYSGSDSQDAVTPHRCPAYVMGGEHKAVMAYLVRDPARGGCAVGAPPAHLGMRLVFDAG